MMLISELEKLHQSSIFRAMGSHFILWWKWYDELSVIVPLCIYIFCLARTALIFQQPSQPTHYTKPWVNLGIGSQRSISFKAPDLCLLLDFCSRITWNQQNSLSIQSDAYVSRYSTLHKATYSQPTKTKCTYKDNTYVYTYIQDQMTMPHKGRLWGELQHGIRKLWSTNSEK